MKHKEYARHAFKGARATLTGKEKQPVAVRLVVMVLHLMLWSFHITTSSAGRQAASGAHRLEVLP